jgi:hypothetical protein
LEGHYNIIEVNPNTGEPLLQKNNAKKFVNQCGVLVRDKVPINICEWKKKNDDPQIPYISDRAKDLLWQSLTEHFNLPAGGDLQKLVKSWALKMMATQF